MTTVAFRRRLLERLVGAMGLGLAVVAAGQACGGEVTAPEDGRGGGGPEGGPTSSSSSGCTPTTVTGGGMLYQTVCIDVTVCPGIVEAVAPIVDHLDAQCCTVESQGTCSSFSSVYCGPFNYSGSPCCWQVTTEVESCGPPKCPTSSPCGPGVPCPLGAPCDGGCCGTVGRPLWVDGRAITAAAIAVDRWHGGRSSDVTDLTDDERRALAAHWEREALYEHASVASFARFTLALLALGAPPELLEAAQRAGLDEVEHARDAFALASAYRGRSVGPGPLALREIELPSTLAELALETFVDGCVNETIAVVQAAERLSIATEPAVRAALRRVVDDETRHAELAWRTVGWAIERGGESVRSALAAWLMSADVPNVADDGSHDGTLAKHGAASVNAVAATTWREVVLPCARALLAEAPTERSGALLSI